MTYRLLILWACFLTATGTLAQVPEDPFFRMTFNEEKRTMVAEFMDLAPAESEVFWPIYHAYEEERQAQGTVRLRILEGYVEDFPDISEEQAAELVEAVVQLEMDMAKLKRKYFRQMRKALSARRAASWLQMENYLELSIRMQIYEAIPFLEEVGG